MPPLVVPFQSMSDPPSTTLDLSDIKWGILEPGLAKAAPPRSPGAEELRQEELE